MIATTNQAQGTTYKTLKWTPDFGPPDKIDSTELGV